MSLLGSSTSCSAITSNADFLAAVEGYMRLFLFDFFNVLAWDKTAELIGKFAKKGSRLLIDGRLQTSKYTNKDGVEVQSVEVIVENFEFAGNPKKDTGSQPDDDDTPF